MPAVELDEPTLVDDATNALSPPSAPLPPPPMVTPRRMRAAVPTQIVAPLPAPALRENVDGPSRIHDTQSTGGQISGEVSSGAPPRHRGARQTRLAAGWIGGAVAAAAMLIVAIGLSAPSPAMPGRADEAMRRAISDREPAPAPRAAVIVEELAMPPRTAPATVPEPRAVLEPQTAPEPPAAKPTRSRHHVSSPSGTKRPAGAIRPPARAKAARRLTYDPDTLFLNRP